MPLPFEQQPKESDKAFAAFAVYLGMGPQRSLTGVAKKMGKGRSQVQGWADEFGWSSRVQAYAAHVAAAEREATEVLARVRAVDWLKRQEEQREQEWRMRGELVELCRELIERWRKKVNMCGSLEGITRMLELASRLGRLASGLPTDKTEITGEGGGPIMVEFEAAVRKVYGGDVEVGEGLRVDGGGVDGGVIEVEAAKIPEEGEVGGDGIANSQ